MGFVRELREPWGLLLASASAGAAWAVQLPVPAALGVGVVVLCARAGMAGFQRREAERPENGSVKVDPGTEEGRWLARAREASVNFASIGSSLTEGPLADQVRGMRAVVDETVGTLVRLAGRASTTGRAASRIDAGALAAEEQRLVHRRESAGEEVLADVDSSLASVRAQRDVYARLSGSRRKLLAQLESGALGLESLVARAVELSAATGVDPVGEDPIQELNERLEGIRRGVEETEQATRRPGGN
jgi:hypothetical protein